jgi:dimethylhistidine N-methyltransferase
MKMDAHGLALAPASRLSLVDADSAVPADFAADVRAGLSARRKRLSCRYFYDAVGSQLFEQICELPEYYLTRAELAILSTRADAIARLAPSDAALVELGSGSARKTRVLIEALLRRRGRLRYVPIDIARGMLEDSSRALLADFPSLAVTAIAAEYRVGLRLLRRRRAQPKLVAWLGSNVGNFHRGEARRFLTSVRATLSSCDRLLLGVDLRKSATVLEAAYDDAAGVTARFNLNLLARINRELGGHFVLERFAHRALWNERRGRVELHLCSRGEQQVRVDALARTFVFGDGETIFTECSYKYSRAELEQLARAAGFALERCWLDEQRRFAVSLLTPQSA